MDVVIITSAFTELGEAPVSFYWETQKKALVKVSVVDEIPKHTSKYLPDQGPEKLNQVVIFSFKTPQRL